MPKRVRFLAVLALAAILAPACTRVPQAVPTPSATAQPSTPTPSPTPPPTPSFDTDRAFEHLRYLVETVGVREAGSAGYREAADYAAEQFASFGYNVSRQRVALPAGESQGVPVPAGETHNIIAAPPGFDRSEPHLLVGGHLDTVAVTQGANDNGSGSAVLLELARLASVTPTAMPLLFVLFGGEERRRSGAGGATFGSRYYLAEMNAAQRRGLKGVLVLDMIGAGPVAYVCHAALTESDFVDAAVANGKRMKLPVQKRIVTGHFSDHAPFERAGFIVAWMWSGEHPTLHSPQDTMSVVQRSSIVRMGRIAWETLRTVRL